MSFPATGRVAANLLLALLRALAALRQSGSLSVRGSRGSKKVFFDQGDVLAVASADSSERLGHYLVGWGFISPVQLHDLLEEQQQARRGLGELAVARRLLDRDAMARLLRIRAEDALFDLARWDDGEYRFALEQSPSRGYLELRLHIEPLLADLERLIAAWKQMGQGVPGPRDVPGVAFTAGSKTLSMTEADILRVVDGRRSLAEIAMASRVSQLEVALVLQNHARGGLVRFTRVPQEAPASTAKLPWPELLREAENCLALADLVDAYDNLSQALATGDTSRELQDRAMSVEARIRAAIRLPETAVLAPGGAVGERPSLSEDEAKVAALIDGARSLGEILDRLAGDRLRNLLLANSLAQCGLVATVATPDRAASLQ